MFPSISNVWINKIVEFTIFYRYVLSTPTLMKHFQSFISSEIISGWSKNFTWNFHFYSEIVKLSRKVFHFLSISSFLDIDKSFGASFLKKTNILFSFSRELHRRPKNPTGFGLEVMLNESTGDYIWVDLRAKATVLLALYQMNACKPNAKMNFWWQQQNNI